MPVTWSDALYFMPPNKLSRIIIQEKVGPTRWMQGYLRVYFEDGSYFSLRVSLATTAREVVGLLLKKRARLHDGAPEEYSLYGAQVVNSDELFERRLEPEECPLVLQEAVREQGHLHQFRFHLRSTAKESPDGDGDEDEERLLEQLDNAKPLHQSMSQIQWTTSLKDTLGSKKKLWGSRSKMQAHSSSESSLSSWRWGRSHTPSKYSNNEKEVKSRWWGSRKSADTERAASGSPRGRGKKWAKCGYLEKKGSRDNAFRMRWFVLQQGKLYYFSNHRSSVYKPISSIDLRTAVARGVKGSREFFLQTTDKSYHLKAETAGDVSEWVRHVKAISSVYRENDELAAIDAALERVEKNIADVDTERSRSLLDLPRALENPRTLAVIHDQLRLSHCEENLDFYMTVKDFEGRFQHMVVTKDSTTTSSNEKSTGGSSRLGTLRRGQEVPRLRISVLDDSSSPRESRDSPRAKQQRERGPEIQEETGDRKAMRVVAKEIYDRYIDVKSPRAICISRKDRKFVFDSIESGNFFYGSGPRRVSCFARVARKVLSTIETQQFHVFSRTAKYRFCLLSLPYVKTEAVCLTAPSVGSSLSKSSGLKLEI
ncbi:hypothetical protein AAMO2058_001425100 [Amorphochlora amoebiformis]